MVLNDSSRLIEKTDQKKFLTASGSLVGIVIAGMLFSSLLSGRVG
jgi:hypothetical protein